MSTILLLKVVVLAQLSATLFTGAFYDGGGDTHHPFFHLAVGAGVDYGAVGIEGYHSPASIRGVVDLYVARVSGTWPSGRFAVRGGIGYSLWRRWTDAPYKESEGIGTSLGLEYKADPAVVKVSWEWFPYDKAPIEHGMLLTLGLRFD